MDKGEETTVNVDKFIALTKKYTEIHELTPTILREFVARIDIHAVGKSNGQRVQDIDLSYNFIGGIPCALARRFAPLEDNTVYWAKGEIDMRRTLQNPYTAA